MGAFFVFRALLNTLQMAVVVQNLDLIYRPDAGVLFHKHHFQIRHDLHDVFRWHIGDINEINSFAFV